MGVSESEPAGTAPPGTPTLACPAPASNTRLSTPSQAAAAVAAAVAAAAAAAANPPPVPQSTPNARSSTTGPSPPSPSIQKMQLATSSVTTSATSHASPSIAAAGSSSVPVSTALPISKPPAQPSPASSSPQSISPPTPSAHQHQNKPSSLQSQPHRTSTRLEPTSTNHAVAAVSASSAVLPPTHQQSAVPKPSDAARSATDSSQVSADSNPKSTAAPTSHKTAIKGSASNPSNTDSAGNARINGPAQSTTISAEKPTATNTQLISNVATLQQHSSQLKSITNPHHVHPQRIQINVTTITGKKFSLDVYTTSTVAEIKYRIFEEEGIPIERQMLVFRDQHLKRDDAMIGEFGVQMGSTLRLVLHMAGGPGPPIKTSPPVSDEDSVIFLLCKQNDDIFMLEVHMRDGDSQKTAAKHILRMAEGISGAKVLQCLDAAEGFEIAEIGELDLDLLRSAIGDDEDEDADDQGGAFDNLVRVIRDIKDPENDNIDDDDVMDDEDDADFEDNPASVFEHSRAARGGRPDSSGSTMSTDTFASFLSHGMSENDVHMEMARRLASMSKSDRSAYETSFLMQSQHTFNAKPRKYQRGGGSAPLATTTSHRKSVGMEASMPSTASASRICSPVTPASSASRASSSYMMYFSEPIISHEKQSLNGDAIESMLEDAEMVYTHYNDQGAGEPKRIRLRTAKKRQRAVLSSKSATRPATAISIMRLPAGAKPMFIIPKSRPASAEQTSEAAISSKKPPSDLDLLLDTSTYLKSISTQTEIYKNGTMTFDSVQSNHSDDDDEIRVTSPATEAAAAAVAAAGRIIEMVSRERRPLPPASPAPASVIAASRTTTSRLRKRGTKTGQSLISLPLLQQQHQNGSMSTKSHKETQSPTQSRKILADKLSCDGSNSQPYGVSFAHPSKVYAATSSSPGASGSRSPIMASSSTINAQSEHIMEFQSQSSIAMRTRKPTPSLQAMQANRKPLLSSPKMVGSELQTVSRRSNGQETFEASTDAHTSSSILHMESRARPTPKTVSRPIGSRLSVKRRGSAGSTSSASRFTSSPSTMSSLTSIRRSSHGSRHIGITKTSTTSSSSVPIPRQQCTICKKKLGPATTFKCRCNQVFCGTHRYSDRHACSFDYRGAAKETLVKENPLVKKDKLIKL